LVEKTKINENEDGDGKFNKTLWIFFLLSTNRSTIIKN